MDIHPAALTLPEMPEADYQAFKADIQKHGQLNPIETLDGQVIDGRHRLRVCQELGLKPKTVEILLLNDMTPSDYVWSLNVARRHLTPAQLAYHRGKVYESRKKSHGGTGANQHTKEQSGKDCHSAKTEQQVAEEFNVSPRTIRNNAAFARGVDAELAEVPEGEQPAKLAEIFDRESLTPVERQLKKAISKEGGATAEELKNIDNRYASTLSVARAKGKLNYEYNDGIFKAVADCVTPKKAKPTDWDRAKALLPKLDTRSKQRAIALLREDEAVSKADMQRVRREQRVPNANGEKPKTQVEEVFNLLEQLRTATHALMQNYGPGSGSAALSRMTCDELKEAHRMCNTIQRKFSDFRSNLPEMK